MKKSLVFAILAFGTTQAMEYSRLTDTHQKVRGINPLESSMQGVGSTAMQDNPSIESMKKNLNSLLDEWKTSKKEHHANKDHPLIDNIEKNFENVVKSALKHDEYLKFMSQDDKNNAFFRLRDITEMMRSLYEPKTPGLLDIDYDFQWITIVNALNDFVTKQISDFFDYYKKEAISMYTHAMENVFDLYLKINDHIPHRDILKIKTIMINRMSHQIHSDFGTSPKKGMDLDCDFFDTVVRKIHFTGNDFYENILNQFLTEDKSLNQNQIHFIEQVKAFFPYYLEGEPFSADLSGGGGYTPLSWPSPEVRNQQKAIALKQDDRFLAMRTWIDCAEDIKKSFSEPGSSGSIRSNYMLKLAQQWRETRKKQESMAHSQQHLTQQAVQGEDDLSVRFSHLDFKPADQTSITDAAKQKQQHHQYQYIYRR